MVVDFAQYPRFPNKHLWIIFEWKNQKSKKLYFTYLHLYFNLHICPSDIRLSNFIVISRLQFQVPHQTTATARMSRQNKLRGFLVFTILHSDTFCNNTILTKVQVPKILKLKCCHIFEIPPKFLQTQISICAFQHISDARKYKRFKNHTPLPTYA